MSHDIDDDFLIPNPFKEKLGKIPNCVRIRLNETGKPANELTNTFANESERQYGIHPIWHCKPDLDNYVKNKIGFTDEEVQRVYSNGSNIFYQTVSREISKLRDNKDIVDWNSDIRTGVWRMRFSDNILSRVPTKVPDTNLPNITSRQFFIALGPWSNWIHTLENPPFRWGVNSSTSSNIGVFNLLKLDDIVYFYSNQDIPKQFSKRGLFGVGKVTRIYDDENDVYWPDEKLKNKVIYNHRFEIESLKLVKTDYELLPWIDGLPFTKGLNHIVNEEILRKLIHDTKEIWGIDLNSNNFLPQKHKLSKDSKTTLHFLSSIDIDEGYDLISEELFIPKEKIIEIITALLSGRHILLAGPIGTGKTRLAMLIPQIFWSRWGGYDSVDQTATSDWSTLDVIGGILPKMENGEPKYDIQNGCVVETVIKNSKIRTDHGKYSTVPYAGTWLVIDEFNRADIDKAFGQLFTALRTRKLKIPTNKVDVSYDNLEILKDYRIIGTLNTADKHFLFNLSDALKSRFAYIEVDIAKKEESQTEIYYAMKNALIDLELKSFDKIILDDKNKRINKEKSDSELYDRVTQAYAFLDTVRIFKKLGTAILKLIFQNLIVGVLLTNNSKNSLDNALTSNLIPQLENLSSPYVSTLYAMHSDDMDSFLKYMYDDVNKQNYVQTFEKILDYLGIPNKEKIILDFEKGIIPNDSEVWNQIKNTFDKKKAKFELNLDQMTTALNDLKKSLIL